MSDANSKLFAAIIDNFCDGQRYLGSDWITETSQLGGTMRFKMSLIPFVDRKGDQVFFTDNYKIYYSPDAGQTIAASIAFDWNTYGWMHMCHIFDNGKIIFGTNKNRIFKTTTAMSSVTEIFASYKGTQITIHTPVSPTEPGEYFKYIGSKLSQYLPDGREIFVYSPYNQNDRGCAPCYVFYSFGDDLKGVFEFGQNPNWRDNGQPSGSTVGTLLGDPTETILVKHGHGVYQDKNSLLDWYACYGDLDQTSPQVFFECKFMKYTYDPIGDTWTHALVKEAERYTRWKGDLGGIPGDGYIYWAADHDGPDPLEQGFFRCHPADIADKTKHTQFYHQPNASTQIANMFLMDPVNGFMMGGGYSTLFASRNFMQSHLNWSPDLVNFHETDLHYPGTVYIFKLSKTATANQFQVEVIPEYGFWLGTQSMIVDFN